MKTQRVAVRFGCVPALVLLGVAEPALAKNGKDQINEASQTWIKAYEARDAGRVSSVYGEEGMLLPPNADLIQGTEAIMNFWKGLLDTGAAIQLDNQETIADGKLGYRMGLYKIFAGDGAMLDRGKYVEIWKRSDDKWWLYRDIWNTSLPPAGK
jgi:ketosteroid isomerase-like protein